MLIENLPILGICGYSGSGKTTLISKIIPVLKSKNLRVAVIKHSHKQIQIDQPGKDSELIFSAGADIFFESEGECFSRAHIEKETKIRTSLLELARLYDLIIVEGHKQFSFPKIWLFRDGENELPDFCDKVFLTLGREDDRPQKVLEFIDRWLPEKWLEIPVYGCVLIGGQSRRMGQPKHLMVKNGKTWLANTIEKLKNHTDDVVVAGAGEMPAGCSPINLQDPPGIQGPMAGIIAAMRWHPWASWIFAACDMPEIEQEAICWLLRQRKPGVWCLLPRIAEAGCEPLLAYYDYRIINSIEALVARDIFRPTDLAKHHKAEVIRPPEALFGSWRNINCLADF